MKTISLIFSLVLLCSFTLSAQKSAAKDHPITQESFIMKLKVQKNGTIQVLSFISSKRKKRSAKITNPGELAKLNLKAGTTIEGTYRFSTFASAGGLGSTRVVKGKGMGELNVSNFSASDDEIRTLKLEHVRGLALRLY